MANDQSELAGQPDGSIAYVDWCWWCDGRLSPYTVICGHAYCRECFPKAEAYYHSLIRVRETWWKTAEVQPPSLLHKAVRDARSVMQTGKLPIGSN